MKSIARPLPKGVRPLVPPEGIPRLRTDGEPHPVQKTSLRRTPAMKRLSLRAPSPRSPTFLSPTEPRSKRASLILPQNGRSSVMSQISSMNQHPASTSTFTQWSDPSTAEPGYNLRKQRHLSAPPSATVPSSLPETPVIHTSNLSPPAMLRTRTTVSESARRAGLVTTALSTKQRSRSFQSQNPQLMSADDLLHEGLVAHENGELEKATEYWRMAANRGLPLGHFFYGIALRHGWGCDPMPEYAVRHLQEASLSTILAMYELGVCFQHGWGVRKNKKEAAKYFKLAADQGDPDAQNDIALCYYTGDGVKKDKFKAAKYYRMAAKQGAEILGNTWIWKEKYDVVDRQ